MIKTDAGLMSMKVRARAIVLLLLLGFVTSLSAHAAQPQGQLYRFTNAQGKVEIAHSIPNDRVKFGYDVLDANGRVVRRVAAELTGAELEAKKRRDAEIAECRATWMRVSTMYQTSADIDRFEAEEIEALETTLANDRAKLVALRGQHNALLAQAASIERSGGTLTNILIQNIERAAGQIKLMEQAISKREKERRNISSRFKNERVAFKRGKC
jgi:predicted metalloendopeptidase